MLPEPFESLQARYDRLTKQIARKEEQAKKPDKAIAALYARRWVINAKLMNAQLPKETDEQT